MRDLNLNELEQVYGAGGCGRNNSPAPPSSCGGGGSQSKAQKAEGCEASKPKHSRHKHNNRQGCYC